MEVDVAIIGGGAAGLMCAIEAAKRGRQVLVIEHANKVGKKILMSGGGRCNFTNREVSASNYLSQNPHFCKSALSRYRPADFIKWVEKQQIPYHEKTGSVARGQLFCDHKSTDILNMLLADCAKYQVQIQTLLECESVSNTDTGFKLELTRPDAQIICTSATLVIASGGLSIPRMGASGFGFKLAQQFAIPVLPTRPGLVGLHLNESLQGPLKPLAGLSLNCRIKTLDAKTGAEFHEALLFTHKGISGPAVLQISSYWQAGERLEIDLLPGIQLEALLEQWRADNKSLATHLQELLPKRLVELWLQDVGNKAVGQYSHKALAELCQKFQHWQIKPANTDGYKTAEVTLGGIDCNAISSKTFESKQQAGLYFIGEVLDVTGWLGGYNFQWAWASGWCAGQFV